MVQPFQLINFNESLDFYNSSKLSYLFIGQNNDQYSFIINNIHSSLKNKRGFGVKKFIFGKNLNQEILNNLKTLSLNPKVINLNSESFLPADEDKFDTFYIYNINLDNKMHLQIINYFTAFSFYTFWFDNLISFDKKNNSTDLCKLNTSTSHGNLMIFTLNKELSEPIKVKDINEMNIFFSRFIHIFSEIKEINSDYENILFPDNIPNLSGNLSSLLDKNSKENYNVLTKDKNVLLSITDYSRQLFPNRGILYLNLLLLDFSAKSS